jgi:predicted dehydrogenase
MKLPEFSGSASRRKIRYGIVALGSISQEGMMPGVHHTGNSEITALVTDDSVKAEELSRRYGVPNAYSYEQFGELTASGSVDALYIATPNWKHAEFAVPALEAGLSVLLEKPMEVSSQACQKIIDAQQRSGAKLMVAYRLHFEPATIAAIEEVRSGRLGEVHFFSSTFCQPVDPKNHRAKNGVLAGPLFDMGPYPINGVRNLFQDEPVEAFATATRHSKSGFGDFDDTVSVILRFPQNRMAQFTVSYFGSPIDTYTVVGPKGVLEANPGFTYGKSLEYTVRIGEDKRHESFKNTDHFGGEMKYFSDCILNGKDPEPDGYEGMADVRVIEAALRSISSGRFEKIEAGPRKSIISVDQEEKLGAETTPEMVHASAPARGKEKNPKN